jgi:hypothetical protein
MLKLASDVGGNPGLRSVTHESGADGLAPLTTLDLDPEDAGFLLPEAIGVLFARWVEAKRSGRAIADSPPAVLRVSPREHERDEWMPMSVVPQTSTGPVAILRDEERTDPAHALRLTEEPALRRGLELSKSHGAEC